MNANEAKPADLRRREARYLLKIALFALPFVIVFGLPVFALWRAGEFMSYEAIQAQRMQRPMTVELTYSGQMYYLDLDSVVRFRPQVLVLGSSRVEEVRSTFFDASATSYTVTPIMQQIGNFAQFVRAIPASSTPRILVIGLDQKFFNPNYDASAFGPDDITPSLGERQVPATTVLGNWWAHWSAIYGYYLDGRFPAGELVHPSATAIGVWAVGNHTGFRNDGSYDPGLDLYSPAYQNVSLSDIDLGIDGFEYADAISTSSLATLDALLADCAARGIHVVGFVPPFSPVIYGKVSSLPANYGYLGEITPRAGALFKKHGFSFFNFTDPTSVGVVQDDMMDGLHPTERGMLKLFVAMANGDPVLRRYADPAFLQSQLAASDREVDVVAR
ncbi:MAG TPA: hypothetical protein VMT99_02255 [Candidatus Paceibacterota bacterium]|nr:hypothetical protein [Candidatus Paceibacterota bacterium]